MLKYHPAVTMSRSVWDQVKGRYKHFHGERKSLPKTQTSMTGCRGGTLLEKRKLLRRGIGSAFRAKRPTTLERRSSIALIPYASGSGVKLSSDTRQNPSDGVAIVHTHATLKTALDKLNPRQPRIRSDDGVCHKESQQ